MPSSSTEQLDLELFGMTCTSCASRIERKLNRLPGANANVNYALEEATISYDSNFLDIDSIIDAVRQAGYDAVKKDRAVPTPKAHNHVWPLGVSAALSAALLGGDLSIWSISRPIAFLLAVVVVLLVGRGFLITAIRDLRHLTGGMDSLVSLGFVTALAWSTAVTFVGLKHEPVFFDAAAIVPTVIYLGRWIENRAKNVARADLNQLQAQILGDVQIRRQGVEMIVPANEILRDDVVTVRPGQVVPTDIKVTAGESTVDTAVITGESDVTVVAPGVDVLAGSLNRDQLLEGVATTSAQRSFLSQLTLQVSQAQAKKANLERISDRISRVFVPIVIAIAIITFLIWLTQGSANEALVTGIAVLVVACPCSLGLATPIAFLVATSRAAQSGILIQSPTVLEQVPKIDTIFLDKTGTLTDATLSFDQLPARLTLIDRERIAAIAQTSTHPVARALGKLATTQLRAAAVKELPGSGMTGTVDGHTVTIAAPQFFNIRTTDGPRTVACQIDDQPPMVFVLHETLRDGARELVHAMLDNGIEVVMLTGDRLHNADSLASALGIETIYANVQPAEKASAIRDAQALGKRVAMVGDGINDAAALAQADLGIALASGTDIAKASADITILGDDILKVPGAITLARATLRNIHQNFAWAIGYNIVAITLAAVGILNPMLAAALMASSSVIVVTNALRLRRWRL
jgi:Cu+-exporting ATPase